MQDKATLLREKWAEALESDKYEQCVRRYENSINANCAVGLGMRIANSLGFKEYIGEDNHYFGARFRRDMGVTNSIMGDNDRGMSFPEIAAKLRNGDYDV